ncbi:hypothetical protein BV25DRAFT_1826746 [Artomyces pyxidatus]|uniref:Uncharacterized protein n=1 Tax=Artomyces pyxidatus TaxID=48021 RepID=A0ACB8SXF1_9AGAM|nr:hypothetical protein BV25DRAFT_1826746 [Artomyces pyxidatus]
MLFFGCYPCLRYRDLTSVPVSGILVAVCVPSSVRTTASTFLSVTEKASETVYLLCEESSNTAWSLNSVNTWICQE